MNNINLIILIINKFFINKNIFIKASLGKFQLYLKLEIAIVLNWIIYLFKIISSFFISEMCNIAAASKDASIYNTFIIICYFNIKFYFKKKLLITDYLLNKLPSI